MAGYGFGRSGRKQAGGGRLVVMGVLLAVLTAGTAASAAQAPSVAQTLIPINNWQPVIDNKGCQWFIQPDAAVNYGTNNFNERGLMLQLQNGINWTTQMQTPDGRTLQFTGQAGALTVQRTFTLFLPQGALQVVDTFVNNSGANQTCAPTLIFQSYRLQPVKSDLGRVVQGALDKKESGVVVARNNGGGQNMPESLLVLGAPGNACKPTVTAQGGALTVQWNLTVKKGASASLMTTLVMQPGASALTGKALEKEFRNYNTRKWCANLGKELRATLVNMGGGGATGQETRSALALLEDLRLPRTDSDQLALGNATVLGGTVSCAELQITTDFGSSTVPVEKVAALAGPAFSGGPTCAFLRDGQVIAGKAEARGLSFVSRTGITLPLKAQTLDRIVFHEDAADGTPAADTLFYLQMFDGSRLAVTALPAAPLAVLSTWGPRSIPFAEILQLEALGEEMLGYRITTRDGSNYFCYLFPEELTFTTALFGPQKVIPARICRLEAAQHTPVAAAAAPGEAADEAPATPYLRLIGESMICGTIDLEALRLQSGGNPLAVPPNQIRRLTNTQAEEEGEIVTPLFSGELWGSGTVAGELQDWILPVRTANGLLRIPARDVVEICVPTPTVPDSVRQRIAQLIRNLGSDDWAAREKASAELKELGVMARQQLLDQAGQTKDEEVRWRVQKLLDALGAN